MPKSRPLTIEVLEDRCTPTTWGNPWPDALHLTLSFAPDGTQVGDRGSALFRVLNGAAATTAWQTEILRAFQTWAVNANINIGLTPDGGQPFGAAGASQGDTRFGDVRLAAYAMAKDVVALGSPFDPAAGTWSGDVKLNSAFTFGLNGTGKYDLFTTLLHEGGHVFGLDHSTDRTSAMFEDYTIRRTGLSSADIAALQQLYGARTPDGLEGSDGNGTFTTARRLQLLANLDGTISQTVDADITQVQDKDFYSFTTLVNTGALTIQLRTSGVSLLTPRVTVYDASGQVVAAAASTNPLNGDLVIRLDRVGILTNYYVKVESARSDVFGIGSYRLRITHVPLLSGLLEATTGAVQELASTVIYNDLHTDDGFATALALTQTIYEADSRYDYAFRGAVSDTWDVDFYKVAAPDAAAGTANVLTATVWGLAVNGLDPQVTVYDANQKLVAAEVLVNETGSYSVQVANATANATYYIKVQANERPGSGKVGDYLLGVDFGSRAVNLQNFAAGNLDQSKPQAFYTLGVAETRLFHFALSADTGNAKIESAVRMTIYDADDKPIFTLVARAGETVTGNIALRSGKYTVRFAAGTKDRSLALPSLAYRLRGTDIDDPIGPKPNDTTEEPESPPSGSGTYSPYWWGSSEPNKSSSSDPYGDPYSSV